MNSKRIFTLGSVIMAAGVVSQASSQTTQPATQPAAPSMPTASQLGHAVSKAVSKFQAQVKAWTPPPFTCKFRETALQEKHGVGADSLSYFISVHDDWAYYITPGGNKIMNLKSGKSTAIPGSYDPVPTPDGKYITMPGSAGGAGEQHGIYWYKADDFRKGLEDGTNLKDAKPLVTDHADGLQDVYQSTGILKRADGKTSYRVADSGNGMQFQDYVVDDKGIPQAVTSKAVRPCSQLADQQIQLPMISKDGQYLSAYDAISKSTKIYHLTDDHGGCDPVIDLGVPTGKVDFDFNNDRIAFHMDFFKFDSSWFSGVSDSQTRDIFVMKVKKDANGIISATGPFARLSSSDKKGYGTYYPRWNKRGQLLASRAEGSTYSLTTFDPTKAQYLPWWSPAETDSPDGDTVKRYALGGLWNNACAEAGGIKQGTSTEASFFAMSLDPKECKKMVNIKWKEYREKVAEEVSRIPGVKLEDVSKLTEKDLEGACPDENIAQSSVTQTGASLASAITPESVFAQSCRDCHTGSYVDPVYNRHAPALTLDSLKGDIDEIQSAIKMIEAPRTKRIAMPPAGAGQLSDEQKRVMLKYLRDREHLLQDQ